MVQRVYDHYLDVHKDKDEAYVSTTRAFPGKMLSKRHRGVNLRFNLIL